MARLLLLLTFISILLGQFTYHKNVDAQAIVMADVFVQEVQGPTVAQKLTSRAKASWPWFIVRSSGIVAALSLVILMLSGIGSITGDTFRFLEPLTAWASHRALGIAFGVSVLVHMFGLLFDRFVPFNILDLLVPWFSDYKPVTVWGVHLGSLYVSLGVLSFYGVALVVISSLIWVEKKPHLWKWVHLLSYLVMLMTFIHALYLGTDLSRGIFRFLWITIAALVGLACVFRLRRMRTML